jgi:glycosyltransferase involved in cell wall biosynthesis
VTRGQLLSVVIIALNEERRIARCLRSVSFADEIIVADTGSTDRTREIAEDLGAKVHSIPFTGFGATKQRAAGLATGEWILSIDADEVVSDELATEIGNVISSPDADEGYVLHRRSWFLGKPMEHGGWGMTRVLRLYRNGKGRFTDDAVHERIRVDGRTGTLNSRLEHYTDPTFPRYLAKLDTFTTLGARKILAAGRRTGFASAFFHAIGTFLRMYLLRAGWRDGARGTLLACSSAYATFLKYAKAKMMRDGITAPFTETELEVKTRDSRQE